MSSPIGVILAAGIGSRLRPLTVTRPKCLVKVCNRTILDYQLEAYRRAGVRELVIVVGYEANEVIRAVRHQKDLHVILVLNTDYESSNNMFSLYLAREYLKGRDFVLSNGDVVIAPTLIARLLDCGNPSAIAIDRRTYLDESMKVTRRPFGGLGDIGKDIPRHRAYGCSVDVYKFSASDGEVFLNEVERIIEGENNRKEWTEVALRRLMCTERLCLAPYDIGEQDWYEIDDFEDLLMAYRRFSGFDRALPTYDVFIFDLDGTLCLGEKPVVVAARSVGALQGAGKRTYFVSNNSSKSKEEYVTKLRGFGIQALPEQIILSSDGLIAWLHRQKIERVFVLGTRSLKMQLKAAGVEHDEHNPEYVVVGYDTELDYAKLSHACSLIHRGVEYVATHQDPFCPSEQGPLPDAGALIALLHATTGVEPSYVFGKPNPEMIETLLAKECLDPRGVLMVGDRLHTDIALAHRAGVDSALVLTGETTIESLQTSALQPTFVLRSVADFMRKED